MLNLHSTKKLINGVEMPRLGLGVYKMTNPAEAYSAMSHALEAGYIAIDTAALYDNEEQVGQAVRDSKKKREELFITSKVWNTDQGYDQTLRAFETSLKKLDMDYLDLYLTHWPVPELYVDTYRAIERLYDEKLIRATGVSNHEPHHLEKLLATANVQPMVNQIELHPHLIQQKNRDFAKQHNIAITSWSPLGRGRVLEDEAIMKLGEKYGKSAAQVIIRWHLQHDLIVIPKSVKEVRIRQNADVFDFELTAEDMQAIDMLNRDERYGSHPDTFHLKK